MAYQPQPGTIPYRAVECLKDHPGWIPSTVELCDALGIETDCFTAYMAASRTHGLVKAEMQPGKGKVLFWSLGDGLRVDLHAPREKDEPLHEAAAVEIRPGPLLPPAAELPAFRALLFEGQLLATGMEIRDGVAVFAPEQWMELKRVITWAQPPQGAAA